MKYNRRIVHNHMMLPLFKCSEALVKIAVAHHLGSSLELQGSYRLELHILSLCFNGIFSSYSDTSLSSLSC